MPCRSAASAARRPRAGSDGSGSRPAYCCCHARSSDHTRRPPAPGRPPAPRPPGRPERQHPAVRPRALSGAGGGRLRGHPADLAVPLRGPAPRGRRDARRAVLPAGRLRAGRAARPLQRSHRPPRPQGRRVSRWTGSWRCRRSRAARTPARTSSTSSGASSRSSTCSSGAPCAGSAFRWSTRPTTCCPTTPARRTRPATVASTARPTPSSSTASAAPAPSASTWRIPAERIAVVPHGPLLEAHRPIERQAARRQLGLPPDAEVVLFTGLIEPYKGLADLVAAFGQAGRAPPTGPTRRRRQAERAVRAVPAAARRARPARPRGAGPPLPARSPRWRPTSVPPTSWCCRTAPPPPAGCCSRRAASDGRSSRPTSATSARSSRTARAACWSHHRPRTSSPPPSNASWPIRASPPGSARPARRGGRPGELDRGRPPHHRPLP